MSADGSIEENRADNSSENVEGDGSEIYFLEPGVGQRAS